MTVMDLTEEHMPFVASCTHTDSPGGDRQEAVRKVRESWLTDALTKGLKVKVAVDDGKPVGFAHCLPIELGTWGMSGKNLMTVPCLTLTYHRVYEQQRGSGYGRALMEAVEDESKKTQKKGVAILAYEHDFWFMPASFFSRLGYEKTAREGAAVIMLKAFERVDPPVMHRLDYRPRLVPGKVIVDAFWTPICPTSILEILTVREVCAEYGDQVMLNEFNCGEKQTLERYQTSRALFVNGQRKDWGYAAPRDEFKAEIDKALTQLQRDGLLG
jgi:GNAT superfamily N-acetyltransferase